MDDIDDRNYLIAAAAWQESLLQSYRSLHLTIQSILLAIGIGLTVVAISGYPSFSPSVLVSAALLTCIAGLHFFSSSKFSGVVLARGEDINWWHAKLIRTEQRISPVLRNFTRFKIHQQARRKNVSHLESMFLSDTPPALTDEQIEELIGKGLGHTRRVIDQQLFIWIGRTWWLLLAFTWGGPIVALLKCHY